MLDRNGRLIVCSQCGHGNWVYLLREPHTYACQRHGWNANCFSRINLRRVSDRCPYYDDIPWSNNPGWRPLRTVNLTEVKCHTNLEVT